MSTWTRKIHCSQIMSMAKSYRDVNMEQKPLVSTDRQTGECFRNSFNHQSQSQKVRWMDQAGRTQRKLGLLPTMTERNGNISQTWQIQEKNKENCERKKGAGRVLTLGPPAQRFFGRR